MNDDSLPPVIELVPRVRGFKCRLMMIVLYTAIGFTPLLLGVWLGYAYNVWIGIAFFLFLTLVSGIVSSKMRIMSIPLVQREMNYSTLAIVKWYVAKHICFEERS